MSFGCETLPCLVSELKFNCPVCGQHIASDSSASGAQIECPTCFQSIIVPQAPKAQSKYILSATQYIKPQPATPPPSAPVPGSPKRRTFLPEILLGLFIACFVAAAAYVLYARAYRSGLTGKTGESTNAVTIPQADWRLDLADAAFPEDAAAGKVRGLDFANERAYLQNNVLVLRQGQVHPPEMMLDMYFPVRETQELAGRKFNIQTNTSGAVPAIVLRWKQGAVQEAEAFTNGYALRIEFGPMGANRVAGRIYLCLPDAAKSFVAGTFSAEIKR